MTEATAPKTDPVDVPSGPPGQPATNRFESIREKTVSMARNHTRLFAFGAASVLCGSRLSTAGFPSASGNL